MYAASTQSATGTIATYARKITQLVRPDLEVILDDHSDDKVYTTFDALSGRVEITAPHNARFDEIQITLEGATRTYVENMAPTAATTRSSIAAKQTFLRLAMPIREADYPQPRIAEAGRTYTFPFNFVVPEQLLPRSCNHEVGSSHVHQAHLQLPPSMGDRSLCKHDDLAPDMAKVQYTIQVKVVRNRERDGKNIVLVEGYRKLRIIPAVAAAPPMSIADDEESDYVLSKTKSLKKGMFSGKLGRITVSAPQPSAIILPSPSSPTTSPASTMTTVNLRFDPHDPTSQPPRLGGLTTKVKATTFYSTRAAHSFPSRFGMRQQFESTRGIYETQVPLSSRCVEGVTWTKHAPSPAYSRRGSATSASSSDYSDSTPTSSNRTPKSNTYCTATIILPIALPATKTWLPTFHTCILSRVYTLELSLSIHTPGTGVPASTASLRLPLQIAAMGSRTSRPALTAAEAAEELANANEYLRPRVLEVPSAELIGTSVLIHRTESRQSRASADLPPSYEDFVAPERRAVVAPGRC